MNTVQKNQKPTTGHTADPFIKISAVELMKMAKPVGSFGGETDFVLRFHKGHLIATDSGDQGGGQN
jgi:hypothetical protein